MGNNVKDKLELKQFQCVTQFGSISSLAEFYIGDRPSNDGNKKGSPSIRMDELSKIQWPKTFRGHKIIFNFTNSYDDFILPDNFCRSVNGILEIHCNGINLKRLPEFITNLKIISSSRPDFGRLKTGFSGNVLHVSQMPSSGLLAIFKSFKGFSFLDSNRVDWMDTHERAIVENTFKQYKAGEISLLEAQSILIDANLDYEATL